jgi:hypothetical protein
MQAYTQGAPALWGEESQYQPMYNQLQQGMAGSNLQAYTAQAPNMQTMANLTSAQAQASGLANLANLGPGAAQASLAATPYASQIGQFAQGQLGSGVDPTLQGLLQQTQGAIPGQVGGFQNLMQQFGQGMSPVNTQLSALSQQAGTDPSQATSYLTNLRNQVGADPRSAMFNQLSGNVMGALGTTSPLLGQLQGMAQQQLALGGQLSPSEMADATQQARAAFASRGMLGSNASVAAELLNRSQLQQQRLGEREQFGMGVYGASEQATQQQIANAMGVNQMDIGATQTNQALAGQLGLAIPGIQQAQITQQAGLQGQLAQNALAGSQQQMALQSAANQTQMGGYQQAAGLQQALLAQQQGQQQMGLQGLQYLGGLGQQGIASVLGQQSQMTEGLMNASFGQPFQGPQLFQSSGLLNLAAQNAMAGYNQMNQANAMNAQSKGAASGAMLGAGAGIAGAAIMGGAAIF